LPDVFCAIMSPSTSTGVLSLGQAWVLGSSTLRWPGYLIALLGAAALVAWAGGLVVDVPSGQGAVRDHVRLALFLSGLVIAALAFWIGALRRVLRELGRAPRHRTGHTLTHSLSRSRLDSLATSP
jgi:hypothetical protein